MSQSKELLAWAASEIAKEQDNKTYGSVTIHMEAGTIIRSEVKRSNKPASNSQPVRKFRNPGDAYP